MTRYHWTSPCGTLMTVTDIAAEKKRRKTDRIAGYWRSIRYHIGKILGRTRADTAASSSVLLAIGTLLVSSKIV